MLAQSVTAVNGSQSYICQFAECYYPAPACASKDYVIGPGVLLYICD